MRYSRYIPVGLFLPKPKRIAGRVLLVWDDLIGDVVIREGVFRLLKKEGYDVWLVVRKDIMPVAELFAERSHLIPIDNEAYNTQLTYRIHFLSQIRGLGFSMAIGSSMHSGVNDNIVANSLASVRWGYMRNNSFKERYKLMKMNIVKGLSKKISTDRFRSVLEHEAHYISAIISKNICVKDILPALNKPEGHDKETYIVYLSDARAAKRVFPADDLMPLLLEYAEKYKITLYVIGIQPLDIPSGRYINNMTGATGISQALSIVRQARGVIGSESGMTHISWLSGIPTVMFLGGGQYGRFMPLCVDGYAENVRLLTNMTGCFGCDWNCGYLSDTVKTVPCVMASEKEIRTALEYIYL